MRRHKNSQKRIYSDDLAYFVVTKTLNNYPFFKEKIFCELLMEEIKLCRKIKNFYLYAWSVMPDHLNLLLQPRRKYDLPTIMQFIKRHFSRDINFITNNSHGGDYEGNHEGDIRECRLRNDINKCRLIENHRQQIIQLKRMVQRECRLFESSRQPSRFQWQKSYYDHYIRNFKDLRNHYSYTINNHLKHGLDPDWLYTSANFLGTVDCLF